MKDKNFVEKNVIFLISLPRSGSTLLQSIIGGHSYVHTTPEPWITLPLLYSQKQNGVESEYDHITATIASSEFFESMLNGQKVLKEARINYLTTIYKQIIEESGKRFYLDKTSRNYLVIKELKELFPKGKFIFLTRNPIAFFSSYLDVMVCGNWSRLSKPNFKSDLINGYRYLTKGLEIASENNYLISYEKIVVDTDEVIKDLCNFLNIKYEKEIKSYNNCLSKMRGKLIDPKSIHKHTEPVDSYINNWQNTINTNFKIRIVREFIDSIGKSCLLRLGYSYESLMNQLIIETKDMDEFEEINFEILMDRRKSKYIQKILDI